MNVLRCVVIPMHLTSAAEIYASAETNSKVLVSNRSMYNNNYSGVSIITVSKSAQLGQETDMMERKIHMTA